jgi:hypothetical protein
MDAKNKPFLFKGKVENDVCNHLMQMHNEMQERFRQPTLHASALDWR